MNHQTNLILTNANGELIGINIPAIKNWIALTTPFHTDVESFAFVHYRAKSEYLHALEQIASWPTLLNWPQQLKIALDYITILINEIVLHDETTFYCNLQPHSFGEICPNRTGLTLPNPEALNTYRQFIQQE